MIDKPESRRIKSEIRQVLMNVWDPIGINDQPACADEYDSYIEDVFGLLTTRATDDAIAAHLADIVNDRMGLSANENHMLATVRALRSIQLTQLR